jgi:hypothetical protein
VLTELSLDFARSMITSAIWFSATLNAAASAPANFVFRESSTVVFPLTSSATTPRALESTVPVVEEDEDDKEDEDEDEEAVVLVTNSPVVDEESVDTLVEVVEPDVRSPPVVVLGLYVLEVVMSTSPLVLEVVISASPPVLEVVISASPPVLEVVMSASPPVLEVVISTSPPVLEVVMSTSPPVLEVLMSTPPPVVEDVMLTSPEVGKSPVVELGSPEPVELSCDVVASPEVRDVVLPVDVPLVKSPSVVVELPS